MSDVNFLDSSYFSDEEKIEMARGDIDFKASRIAALEAQLAVSKSEIVAGANDSLRLIDTIKYLRGIAERGEAREQRNDETVGSFVLGYVKRIEAQLAASQEALALANSDRATAWAECKALKKP